LPGDVLLIEGLGSAPSSTEPARIVRWVVQLASKPKPPPRAKLVAARPELLGLARQRETDEWLSCTEENGLNPWPLASQKLQRRPALEKGAEGALEKHGLLTEDTTRELVRLAHASRTKSGALAAKGRTARGRTALMPLAKRHFLRFDLLRWLASMCIRLPRCLTFDLSGWPEASPLEGRVSRRFLERNRAAFA